MQVKLLRVLQDKEVCMVGSSRSRKVDVRILASTNKDLLSLVKKGGFREDLFFRLNVITIDLPPKKRERMTSSYWASILPPVSLKRWANPCRNSLILPYKSSRTTIGRETYENWKT